MKQHELAKLFYTEILKKQPVDAPPQYEHVQDLFQLMHTVFFNVTEQERIQFTTFFSRIAFAFQKYQVPPRQQFYIHAFRKAAQRADNQQDTLLKYQLGLKAVTDAIKVFYQEDPPVDIINILPPPDFYKVKNVEIKGKIPFMQVVVLKDDTLNEAFEGTDEDTGAPVKIKYNLADRNDNFRKSVTMIQRVFRYPITLNLFDIEVDTEGALRPRAFVIEPDHLIDVTAVAECFRPVGEEPLLHLLNKFLPMSVSTSIMKGHIANFFLDELVANPEATFQETIRKVFKINPLAFCTYDDAAFREIIDASQGHFIHLKMMMATGLPKEGIDRENCYLEPSFYAPKYGLQGRLDLFYQNPDTNKSAIVELKSGKPFKPNIYGISVNHFTQTLLYDLMIDAAFKGKTDPTNYILYSVLDTDNLKFAPAIKAQQNEALNVRNQVLALEQALININKNADPNGGEILFKRLIDKLLQGASGFEKSNIVLFEQTYNGLSDVEKKYFAAFASFTAREHQLAKVGISGVENINGVAALWLDDHKTKEENFNIFSFLKIQDNQSHTEDALIVFEKTEKTNPLANFRVGDIVVLYPVIARNEASPVKNETIPIDSVLNNQIFKCNIVAMQKETVTLRLRSRQLNQYLFNKTEFWHVEHDLLDSSFNGMYRGLFEFARATKRKRDLLLATSPPQNPIKTQETTVFNAEMTEEQNRIFQKIIVSKDYFLLWGPPGTGKTSVMLKHLVGYFLKNTDENILLLAYTNRAVDEICEAIESLGDWVKTNYIRIGSRYATAPQYHEQLLDFKIGQIKTRKELKEVIQGHRVFVATVASMSGKQELFQLKKFHRVMIDEASQILEPLLVGLLPHFEHFTLIGDHKQLPAVVTQSEIESKIEDEELNSIGLKNLRNSLFERLYKRAVKEEWTGAYDVLSHQGRMHQEIMVFPSETFYERKLKILPEGMNQFQVQNIDFQSHTSKNRIDKALRERRVLFINTDRDTTNNFNKTNAHEAHLIGDLVQSFEELYRENGRTFHPLSIGVITPYRAQIAQIQAVLRDRNFDIDKITIDTVERYQGGARDVILLSLCTNEASQLASLVSLSEEGVDRKLNVALTRARQHLVVVGNAEILQGSPIYKWFVEEYGLKT
jgi:DNA replication ATP-dependent helicase Dna2